MSDVPDDIVVSEDGVTFPVIELLTGRGFVTGKSGSGKSNTASVIAEELLEVDLPLLIVDTDGEYYGLKERYELLHVGAGEICDVQVGPQHAETLASLALEQNVPVVLDVSEYLDRAQARQLIHGVVRTLFVREKQLNKPFLLLVEEIHEYLPESGALDEVGEVLLQVAKRGRKRGLGLCGISQRPAAVDKDFITQCDWLVWHRLTWENDTKVVGRFLDSDYAEAVEDLEDGEGIVVTDWDEMVRRVQFRRKRTFDAGATPGLEDVERPDLREISAELEAELKRIGSGDPASAVAATGEGSFDDADGDPADETGEGTERDADPDAGGVADDDADGVADDAASADGTANEASADPDAASDAAPVPATASPGSGSAGPPDAGSGGTAAEALEAAAKRGPPPARGRPAGATPDEERDDLVWESGQLVAYAVRTGLDAAGRTARRARRRGGEIRTRAAAGDLDRKLVVAALVAYTLLAVLVYLSLSP